MDENNQTKILIERVQDGDSSAVQQLLSRYQSRVLAAVRLRLGSGLRRKVESTDIVQEVLADAFRRVEPFQFENEKAFLYFLNRIVTNKIRDEADKWKAEKRNPQREADKHREILSGAVDPVELVSDPGAKTPSMIITVKEDLEQLEQAMDALGEESQEYRDLVVSVKIEGMSYRELAQCTGSSEDAVRMKTKRAILRLTSIMAEMNVS